jgi:predicted PurR-regulated permease PerM
MTPILPQRQTLAWAGLGAAALLLVWLLAPVLTPFLVGAVLAYALHPAVERLAARRVPRLLAVIVVEAVAIVALLSVMLLIVPILAKEIPLLREQIPVLADRINRALAPWLAQWGLNATLDIASIKAWVRQYLDANLDESISHLLNSARIGGSIVLAMLGNAILVPVVLFYLLMDWARLVESVRALVPPRLRPRVEGFVAECDTVLGQYLRGQLLVMVILAAYYSIALALAGFDLALPVGVFTGLAIAIPYVGFGLGLVLAILTGLLEFASWYPVIVVAAVYGIGQLVESLVLTPRLVGERIGMSPLTVIFALLAFGHLFGFVGVLIALPVSALLVVAVRRLRAAYVASPLYGR